MAKFTPPKKIKGIFREFWDKSYDDIYLSMAGMADIWEGPGNYPGALDGNGTIIGMQYFGDSLYIIQGGGSQTMVKVISPNGTEIHLIGSSACLMTHTPHDVYGSMTVLNEYEIIFGYLYINLDMQFSAPYGLDLSQLWDNSSVKITTSRVSSTSWVTAIKSAGSIQLFLHQKANPEDCLPCSSKEASASGVVKFSCREENYSREALQIDSYRASRSMMATGANMSVTSMDGLSLFEKKPMPKVNTADCILAMDEYVVLFNKSKISPTDIGDVGKRLSRSCSRVMYGNMLQTIQYKKESEIMYDDYIEDFIKGEEDNSKLYEDSKKLVGLISPLLSELKDNSQDSELMKVLFSDQVWWAPMWFINNEDEYINTDSRINPYTLLHEVSFDDFFDLILSVASSMPPMDESQSLPMGWIIMSDSNSNPVKYSKTSMTYFRFPFALCMSSTKLSTLEEFDLNAICDVETRPDGVLVWGWRDISTYKNQMYNVLKCYKISNDGVLKLIDSYEVGYDMSPIDNSAKAVGISSTKSYWIVRDFYLKDSTEGGIDYVETKVNISNEMSAILLASNASEYANVNEVIGRLSGAKSVTHYGDGLLDAHYDDFDLDDDSMDTRAWGNTGGRQYDYVRGYSGYMIHSPDLL